MRKLTIAIDYDDTYTADPKLWNDFINSCRDCEYTVYIVTMRSMVDYQEDLKFKKWADNMWLKYGIDTILCDGLPKQETTERYGITVDIWIDDNPRGIYEGSRFTPEQLKKWRENGRR